MTELPADDDWPRVYLHGLRLARAGTLGNVCEFDWFAVDLDGRLAVFETASFGFHPPSELLPSDADYIDAMREVWAAERLRWGDDHAEPMYEGLYVYDWRMPTWQSQHYIRVRQPGIADVDALEVVRSTAVQLDIRFAETPSLQQAPVWRRTRSLRRP